MGNRGKRYDAEFKADAARLVKESGRSVASVAKDLGVNPQTLRNWLRGNTEQSSDKARMENNTRGRFFCALALVNLTRYKLKSLVGTGQNSGLAYGALFLELLEDN